MKALIQHLLKNNIDEILEKSLINCHCVGVHSIMLIDKPGSRIRMFITERNHEMWRNTATEYHNGMSISFHPHHCNVTLLCVYGHIFNWNVGSGHPASSLMMDMFVYNSAITNGKIGFELKMRDVPLKTIHDGTGWLQPEQSVFLLATMMHTVGVGANEISAWIVIEGNENADYIPVSYSNAPLDKMDFSHLYKPMSYDNLMYLLESIDYI